MEWQVVGVIVVLVGLFAAVAKPLINLNTTIARLTTIVESLQGEIKGLTSRNSESHDRIFTKLDEHDDKLAEHDKDIAILKNKEVKTNGQR